MHFLLKTDACSVFLSWNNISLTFNNISYFIKIVKFIMYFSIKMVEKSAISIENTLFLLLFYSIVHFTFYLTILFSKPFYIWFIINKNGAIRLLFRGLNILTLDRKNILRDILPHAT